MKFGYEFVALVKDKSGTITNQAVFHDEEKMNAWFKRHVHSGLFADKSLICVKRQTFNGKTVYIDWHKVVLYGVIVALASFIVWRLIHA